MIIFSRTYKSDNIINKIKGFPVVSFDIFDTLVIRSFSDPRDLFIRVARDYNRFHSNKRIDEDKFYQDRKEAALAARKIALEKGREETNLEEIYSCLNEEYKGISDELISLEIQREIECCYPNPLIKKVYDWCLQNNKKVFFTSDMYLSKNTIEKILSNCGYTQYTLLLSSDQNSKKANGKLFEVLIKSTSVDASRIAHIGDHPQIDYYQARRKGIYPVLIPHNSDSRNYKRFSSIKNDDKQLFKSLQIITGKFVEPSWNQYYRYGFEVVGVLLYGFVTWLQKEALEHNYDKLFFLSRDGYLMQEAYNYLFEDKAVNNSYFYVSRKSLSRPQFWMNPTLEDILEPETPFHYWSYAEFCELLGLDENRGKIEWVECGLDLDGKYSKKEILSDSRFAKYFELFKDEIIESSKNKFTDVIAYMKQEEFSGNIAIVDVGWAGAIQKYLNRMVKASSGVNTNIFGYYLGFKPKTVMGTQAASYIPQALHPSLFCSHLMEYPFTKMVGTTIGYNSSADGRINPVLAEYEFTGTLDEFITSEIQKGMMDFIRIIKSGCFPEYLDYSIGYAKIKMVTKKPRLKDIKNLENLTHVNHGLTYQLASPRSVFYYMMHVSDAKIDLSNSGWKIGFLKKLLKLPLPYCWLLEKIRGSSVD